MGYTVYKHTTPSNKVYIGITSQNVNKRWQNGYGYTGSKYFSRAISKYGWDNIRHDILYENLTKERACEIEIELIDKYKSYDYHFGYNISRGGELGMSKPVCKYDYDGNLISEYYTLVDAALIENIEADNIRMCCLGKTNASNGYIWRYKGDAFNKYFNGTLRISEKGKVYTSIRKDDYKNKIYKYNKSGELLCVYNSVYDIPDYNSKKIANIIRCCRGEIKTSIGYVWRFDIDNNVANNTKIHREKSRKRIVQYDVCGNIIKIWDSIQEAKTAYHSTSIDSVLCGKRHTACGYVWRYEDERFDKYSIDIKKSAKPRKYDSKPVYQYDKAGNFIFKYNSVYEIDRKEFAQANVIKCLLGEISYTKGFIFTFEERIAYDEK